MQINICAFAVVLIFASTYAISLDSLEQPGFPDGRIINGKEAQPGEAPFIVSLEKISHFCAGSIIDQHWVLTAGHCLTDDQFTVVAGLHNRIITSNAQVRKIQSKDYYIVHPDYSGSVGPNDIGLIYIAEPFDLNTMTRDGNAPVAKITLPSGRFEHKNEGRIFGWGRDNDGLVPLNLQMLDVNIIGYEECKAAMPSKSKLSPVNICSHKKRSIEGACNGDSGGPLVRITDKGYELVGVVSWVYTPCTLTTYPSVYTWTTAYESWINDQIHKFVVP